MKKIQQEAKRSNQSINKAIDEKVVKYRAID